MKFEKIVPMREAEETICISGRAEALSKGVWHIDIQDKRYVITEMSFLLQTGEGLPHEETYDAIFALTLADEDGGLHTTTVLLSETDFVFVADGSVKPFVSSGD